MKILLRATLQTVPMYLPCPLLCLPYLIWALKVCVLYSALVNYSVYYSGSQSDIYREVITNGL